MTLLGMGGVATATADLACELFVGPGCDLVQFDQEVTSDTKNALNVEGVLATEFAFSFAKAFQVAERKLPVGIKPKLVDLQSISYTESIKNIDGFDSLTDQKNRSDLDTFTTVDLGLAYDVTDSVRLGLNVRDLITDKFNLGGSVLSFDTEARMGVAYHNNLLAVDYGLTENKPLLANPQFDDLKTQLLVVGAEFNSFDYSWLRIGARKNVASSIPGAAKDTALTAGIGFWLGFNIDLAATYADNSVGAFVQTGFRF